jgi:hypothetical protein
MDEAFSYWISKNERRAGGRGELSSAEQVKDACRKGWVRVRKYTAPDAYLSILVDDLAARADPVRRFLFDILATGRIATDETAVLSAFDSGEVLVYALSDGGVEGLLSRLEEL